MTERHVGFTGTQNGMTEAQRAMVAHWLERFDWIHHGDCVGADAEAHVDSKEVGLRVFLHPPVNGFRRAFCAADEAAVPLPYLERNRAIVDATEELVAAPKSFVEERRSGTWATVRHARKQGKPVTIVYPDGSLEFSP